MTQRILARTALGLLALLTVLACVAVWLTPEERRWGLTREAGDLLQTAARPYVMDGEIVAGWTWPHLRIERTTARFELSDAAGATVDLWLFHPDVRPPEPGRVARGERVAFVLPPAEHPGFEAAAHLAERILEAEPPEEMWHDAAPRDGDEERTFARFTTRLLQNVWILLLVLLAALAARALVAGGASRRREALGLCGLALGALLLRWGFATWGPGDLQMNLFSAFSEFASGDLTYGEGADALLLLVFTVLPRSFDTVIVVNLALGALAPVLMVWFARAWFGRRDLGWIAGLLLALQPILVRNGGEANRQAILLFASLAALAPLASALRTEGRGRLLLFASSGLAALIAVRSRPEALLLFVAAALLVSLARPLRRVGTFSFWQPVLATLVAWGPALWLSARTALSHWHPETTLHPLAPFGSLSFEGAVALLFRAETWRHFAFARVDVVPPGYVALLVLGIVVPLLSRRGRDVWGPVLFVGVSLVYLVLSCALSFSCVTPNIDTWLNARYQTLLFLPGTFVAARAAVWLLDLARKRGRTALRVASAVLLVIVVATGVPSFSNAVAKRLIDREYAFVLEEAGRLPSRSRVYVVWFQEDVGLKQLVREIPSLAGWRQEWAVWSPESAPEPGERSFYYHTATCAAREGRPALRAACDEALARYGAYPVADRELPTAGPGRASFDRPTVKVGFYEMRP